MANQSRKILEAQKRLQRELKAFVTVMGVEAKNHFVASFRNQGFTDETLVKWKPRKRESYRTKRGAYVDDTTRAILIGKGRADLKKSVRVVSKSYNTVTLGSDLIYAQIHNDGLEGRAWGKYPFKMPKRQFIGNSRKLTDLLKMKLNLRIQTVFR